MQKPKNANRGNACGRSLRWWCVWGMGLWLFLLALPVGAQWVAFNDHFRGTNTALFATDYNTFASSGVTNSGYLRDIVTGMNVPVTLTITNKGVTSSASSGVPAAGTPAATVFGSFIDWGKSTDGKQNSILLPTNAGAMTAHIFTGLDTSRKYSFKATSVFSNVYYANRWSLCRMEGANSFRRAHSANVLTAANAFTSLATNEAAFGTGHNAVAGDIIDWEDIVPASGTLIVYTHPYPGKISTTTNASGAMGYSLTAIRFEEMSPISMVTQPQDINVCVGNSAALTVGVVGTDPRYQWRKIFGGVANDVPGATNQSLTLTNILGPAEYFVVVSNSLNAVTSRIAQVAVASIPITVSAQPQDQTNVIASCATFRFEVDQASSRAITVQWYFNSGPSTVGGTPISDATDSQVTLTNLSLADAGYYYAVLTNCAGSVTSRLAALEVYYEPVQIVSPPQDATVTQGGSATFYVTASGSKPYGYQWYKGGTPLVNKTNASLNLTNLQVTDSGAYSVLVTNAVSAVMSGNALMIVVQAPYDIVKLYSVYPAISNSIWKYNQQGIDLGTAWREPSYDGSSWPSGKGGLMVEDDPTITAYRGTTLSLHFTNGTNAVLTHYFRTSFVLTNDPREVTIYTTNIFDDGMVVYLNGKEAYRMNMPEGEITYATLAPGTITEGVIYVTNLPSGLLVQGTNCLAVEVHQVNNTSSDVVMCLGATVVFPPAVPISITDQPRDLVMTELGSATLAVGYAGSPAYFQWRKDDVPIAGATRATLVFSNALESDIGQYFVVISNVLGAVTSQVATVTVLLDRAPPELKSAIRTQNPVGVLVTFSERVEPASATSATNYAIWETASGRSVAVRSATLVDGANVALETDPLAGNLEYLLVVKHVRDVSPAGNEIAPDNRILIGGGILPLIPIDATWRHNDTGEDPGVAWREPGFDDSGWPRGSAVLYHDDWLFSSLPLAFPTNTVLAVTNTLGRQIVTHYFRHRFDFLGSPDGAVLRLRPVVDDGAVFYLNGVEVFRIGLNEGPVSVDTPASRLIGDGHYEGPFLVPVTNLCYGENVLAVETHQAGGVLDVTFGLEMEAVVSSFDSLAPFITAQPRNQAVVPGETAVLSAVVSAPGLLQWLRNGVPIPEANQSTLSVPSVAPAEDGAQYCLLASNAFGVVTSAVATLSVIADGTRPELLRAMLVSHEPPSVLASFSVALDPASATNISNYALTNALGPDLAIAAATLIDRTNVLLTVSEWWPGAYTVVASGVRHLTPLGGEIAANSRVTVGLRSWPLVDFSTNTMWKYNQAGVNLGIAWYGTNYNDAISGWETGRSVFDGRTPGDGSLTIRASVGGLAVGTILTNIVLRDQQYIYTYYFRTLCYVPLTGPGATQALSCIVDDGAAFYANGKLFYSLGVNTPAAYGDQATRSAGNPAVEGPFSVNIANLVAGSNLLAAEVHQVGTASSDIDFGADLRLNVPSLVLPPGGPSSPPPLKITYQPKSAAQEELRPVRFTVGYRGYAAQIQWYKRGLSGPELVPGATSPTLVVSRPILGVDDGAYFAVLSNSSNLVTSADASLSITQTGPVIVQQPAQQTVGLGEPARFEVVAYGSRSCSYQWRFNNEDVPDATNDFYLVPAVRTNDCGSYSVVVSNALGAVLSQDGHLALSVRYAVNETNLEWVFPDIPWFGQTAVTHDGEAALQSGDVSGGGLSTVQAMVRGPGLLSFWWKKGEERPTSILQLQVDGQTLEVYSAGTDWQRKAFWLSPGDHTLAWVFSGPQSGWLDQVDFSTDLSPTISAVPFSTTVPAGTNVIVDGGVGGYPPLQCQWYFNELPLAGATNPVLALRNVQPSNAGLYALTVENLAGAALFSFALAVTGSPPAMMPQPLRRAVFPGGEVRLEANALGSEPRTYQWRFEGVDIPGATHETLDFPHVDKSQAGHYSVVVSNALGWVVGPEIELVLSWSSYVIHISMDGMSGKYVASALESEPARYPNFMRLVKEGTSTLNARCDPTHVYTVPNHLSMLTGRPVSQPPGQPSTVHHGYTDNWTPSYTTTVHNAGNPDVPYKASVFDVAHDRGLSTAFLVSKSSLTVCAQSYDGTNGAPDLVPPDNGRNKVDLAREDYYDGKAIVDAYLTVLGSGTPYNYAFLHFRDLDTTGHYQGWGSAAWFDTLCALDTQMGRLLWAIEDNVNPVVSEQTTIIVTADHGGYGYGHSNNGGEWAYRIPIFCWGFGFAAGADLYTLFANRTDPGTNWVDCSAVWQPLRNGDTGNLALSALGLPPIPGSYMIPQFATETPSLSASLEGATWRIEWPAGAAGFRLETSSSLGPLAPWTPVVEGVATNVNSYIYRAPDRGGAQFYRLAK